MLAILFTLLLFASPAAAAMVHFSGTAGSCAPACQSLTPQPVDPGEAFFGSFTLAGDQVSDFFVSFGDFILTADNPVITYHDFTDGPKQWAAVTGTVPGGVMSIGLTTPWKEPEPELLHPTVVWDCLMWSFCGFQIKAAPFNLEGIRTNIEDPAAVVAFRDIYSMRENGYLDLVANPEPGTMILLGTGLVVLALRSTRRT